MKRCHILKKTMNPLESTLSALVTILDQNRIRYMVIGGMANVCWGEPRATIDIDVTVWATDAARADVIALLQRYFRSRVAEPGPFVEKTRVFPLISNQGVPIDVIFGLLPYEEEAINRAVIREIAGAPVRICTPEDLILHKIISKREQDQRDARKIALHQKGRLDLDYLEPRIRSISVAIERPEIWDNWNSWKALGRD